jgi:hypothetical protein
MGEEVPTCQADEQKQHLTTLLPSSLLGSVLVEQVATPYQ